jgi:regulatory protein YycI of two-component signal transduction system YycFG
MHEKTNQVYQATKLQKVTALGRIKQKRFLKIHAQVKSNKFGIYTLTQRLPIKLNTWP